MIALVNPGSEPVRRPELGLAEAAVDRFVQQATQVHGLQFRGRRRLHSADRNGRFGFVIAFADASGLGMEHEIVMPGVRLRYLEYRGQGGGRVRYFYRLYLNGVSWLWPFAISLCGAAVRRG